MSEVLFYHLEQQTLEQALPLLLDATMKRGWKAVVQAGSAERVAFGGMRQKCVIPKSP